MPIDDVLEKIQTNEEKTDGKVPEVKTETDFDKLLSQLTSEDARTTAIVKAVEKNLTKEEKHLRIAINYNYNAKNFKNAGMMCEKLGEFDSAINCYIKGNCIQEAADVAVKKGDYDWAIDLLEKNGRSVSAGRIAEQKGKYDLAIDLYKKGQANSDIARLFEKKGNYQNALEYYAKANDIVNVKRIEKSLEYKKERIKIASDYKNFKYAASISEEIGDLENAMDFYARIGDYASAYRVAQKTGDAQKISLYQSLYDLLSDKEQ